MNKALLGVVAALGVAGAAQAAGSSAMDHTKTESKTEPKMGATESKMGGTETKLTAKAEALRKQLDPELSKFDQAWNKADPKAMAEHFSQDAVIINPQGRKATGREEITQLFKDETTTNMKGTTMEHQVVGVRPLGKDLAFVDTEMTITGAKDQTGKTIPEEKVHGAFVMGKEKGKWVAMEARPYMFAPGEEQGVGGSGMEPGMQPGMEPGMEQPPAKPEKGKHPMGEPAHPIRDHGTGGSGMDTGNDMPANQPTPDDKLDK